MAVSVDQLRRIALSLPETVEADHHGRPSFRVGGRIFATLPTSERVNVMLDEGGILTALEAAPGACEPVFWGARLRAVGVSLERADRRLLERLLGEAWEEKAPARLRRRPPRARPEPQEEHGGWRGSAR